MNFSSINSNVDIDVKSVMPKSEQQRAQNVARHNPENFQASMREDFLTLSNYAVEFKDFNEMLEKEPEIREDEAAKSEKRNKEDEEDKEAKEDKEDREDKEDKDLKKGKYKTYAIYDKKDLYNDEDSEGIIDQWG